MPISMKQSRNINNPYDSDTYGDIGRFMSYFYQIKSIRKTKTKNILEIGIGTRTVSSYLKSNGYDITTCDLDAHRNPDIVGDIRNIPINDNSFDSVIACEILEHIPWNDFELALSELHRVSRKYVIISIPYKALSFQLILKTPLIGYLFNNYFISLVARIPLFLKKHKFDGDHYWEMGARGHSKAKIKKILKRKFKIINEDVPLLATNHHFFVLKKI